MVIYPATIQRTERQLPLMSFIQFNLTFIMYFNVREMRRPTQNRIFALNNEQETKIIKTVIITNETDESRPNKVIKSVSQHEE